MSDLRLQSFVERYVATLFASCQQIATIFETDATAAAGRNTTPTNTTPRLPCLARSAADSEELDLPLCDSSVGSASDRSPQQASRPVQPVQPAQPAPLPTQDDTIHHTTHTPLPSTPHLCGASPSAPSRPRRRSFAARMAPPGPWAAGDGEAPRLWRLLAPVQRPSGAAAERSRRGASARGPGGAEEAALAHRRTARRASVSSVARSGMGWHSNGPSRQHSPNEETKEESTSKSGTPVQSIFALPGEEDEMPSKRAAIIERPKRGRGSISSKKRASSKGYLLARRQQAEQVNRTMEAKLLERFRLAKEEDEDAVPVPKTSKAVMMLHQLAMTVNLSFDDARLAKNAFEKQDHQVKGVLEYEDFVQAVLDIHQTINHKCTAFTMTQCEHLCATTYPADEGSDGTVDLVQFLHWYATYSFHESLLLSPEMRNLRRLSRQYQVPWEEVDNVKRHFDLVDTDHSGEIDFEEFSQILRRVLQVPPELDMPPNRARFFWKQLDTDGSGKADFAEFLPWWLKYFQQKEGKKLLVKPFEDFYQSVRNLKNPDPPAYKKTERTKIVLQTEDKGGAKRAPERRLSMILTERRFSRRFE